jgi:hypothetical protein
MIIIVYFLFWLEDELNCGVVDDDGVALGGTTRFSRLFGIIGRS